MIQLKNMAKIFISYHNLDKKLVDKYINELRHRKHEIIVMDSQMGQGEENMKDVLMNAQKKADGTLVFLTKNSMESLHVVSEMRIANAYMRNNKFFIPLVQREVSNSNILKEIQHITIDDENFHDTVEQIDIYIQKFLSQNRETNDNLPLAEGSKGERVEEIQKLLSQIGPFNIVADGIYGDSTASAVSTFQKDNHLNVTGEVDQETYEAIRSFSTVKKVESNYWILKINEKNWENLKSGLVAYFSTYMSPGSKRPGYENFQKLRKGDHILGYAYFEEKAIVCTFQLTEEIHPTEKFGEIIRLQVTKVLEDKIPLSAFVHISPSLQKWEEDSDYKLYMLTSVDYNTILSLTPQPENKRKYQKFYQTDFSTDSVDGKLVDKLNVLVDVQALASVITYSKIKPPLAIGLFGTWGSGKSFFMKLLREEVDRLATSDNTGTYCKEIVHVSFNSWYYSDANLWASLVTKIFEELKKKGDEKKQSLEDLYKKLNSAKELHKETQERQAALQGEINVLQEKADAISEDIRVKAGTMADVSNNALVKAVFNNEEVKKDLDRIQQNLPHPIINNIQQINENLISLGSTSKRFYDSLKIIWSFKKGKFWIVLITALFFLALPQLIKILLTGNLSTSITKATLIIGSLLTITSNIVIFIIPLKNKIDTVYRRLVSLKETIDIIENEEIAVKKELLIKVQSDIADRETKIQELKNDIDEIATGKKLASFIESRVTDQRYINSLGIISWIRKDFEELGALLDVQSSLKKEMHLEENDGDSGLSKLKDKAQELEVNRIMLYIDDLDRCNKETVLRVLEAIHLLLAFDLFVVVVGVDPRWVYNALQKSYSEFLNGEEDKTINKLKMPEYFWRQATPFDYLEKIFQIPFLLKPINRKGREDLIAAQFVVPASEDENKENGYPLSPDIEAASIAQVNNQLTVGTNMLTGVQALPSNLNLNEELTHVPDQTDKTTISLLKISHEEIGFMKSIAELIGDTPRTIKRFTNIYRIVRVHTNLEIIGDKIETYCAVMIVLGIITGLPNESNRLLIRMKKRKGGTLSDLVKEIDNIPAELKNCTTKKYQLRPSLEKQAGDIPLQTIQLNLDLVIRFSFRSYHLTEEMQ